MFFSLALVCSACKKNDPSPNGNGSNSNGGSSSPCQTNNTGEITFTNVNSTNPYNCYVNGSFVFQVNGNGGTSTATVTAGSLSLKAVQASGYAVYPTTYTQNLPVAQCGTGTWNF